MDIDMTYPYARVLDMYAGYTPAQKAGFILEHYERLEDMIASYESDWRIVVSAEIRHNQRYDSQELGVKIQHNSSGDPTMYEAINCIEMDTARSDTELLEALRHTDDPEAHMRERRILQDMLDDLALVRNSINRLSQCDREIILRFLLRNGGRLQDIADELDISLVAFKKRGQRLRRMVVASATASLALKYGLVERR